MRVFVAYKIKGEDLAQLRQKLEELSRIIEDAGHKTFIFLRDVEHWKTGMDIKEIVRRAMKELAKCDVIVAEVSEKARGTYFEIGYAKALGKKVIIIYRKGSEVNFLKAAADAAVEYENLADLKIKLPKALK